MGTVIGRSDRTASEPDSNPISSSNVLATVMHSLFDIGELRVQTNIPRNVEQIITSGKPIAGLV